MHAARGILHAVALLALLSGCGNRYFPDSAPSRTLVQLVLSPASLVLAPGETQQFTVSGTRSDGSGTVPAVTYSATGGTITAGGLYTAGATEGTFSVIATQQGGTRADTSAVTLLPSLRVLAAARGFTVGTAVNLAALVADSRYRQMVGWQFNSVAAEDVMKFAYVHPAPTQYTFGDADSVVAFAQVNGMAIHGHTLVWHGALPGWITNGTFTKAQLLAVLKDHIMTVVGHYRGKVATWDVVNEVMGDNGGSLRSTIWLSTIGPEFIDSAFVWAHRADPVAKLYLNDFGAESISPKADSILQLVEGLRARGVPIDGVGFQAHFSLSPPAASSVRANFGRFAAAGFDVRVSEMDVRIADGAGSAEFATQGAIYHDVLDACLLLTRCTGFTAWGFTDLHSWIPSAFPGFGRALPFDSAYQAKAAFDSLVARLQQP